MGSVIETGARFLLDPAIKHEPTLINPAAEGRKMRIHFLKRAIDIAAILGSEAVSFWAGKKQPEVDEQQAWHWLALGIGELLTYAEKQEVSLALEPEPGMLIETIDDLHKLRQLLPDEQAHSLCLALDVGHVWVTGEMKPAEAVRQYAGHCGTAAIEGMKRGVHEHLPLHKGDMDVSEVLTAFREQQFDRLICVELSRESHRAHEAIRESMHTLRQMEQSGAAV
jgi:sugar phosphate isomerase/epimerase